MFDRLKLDLKAEVASKSDANVRLDEALNAYKEAKDSLKEVESERDILKDDVNNLSKGKEELQMRYNKLMEVQGFWTREGARVMVQSKIPRNL